MLPAFDTFSEQGSLAEARDKKKLRRFSLFQLLHLFLDMLDFDAVFADIEPQVRVNAHVLVGDPDEREKGDEVTAPIVEQQFVTR